MWERIKDYRKLRGQSYFRGNGKLRNELIRSLQKKIDYLKNRRFVQICFPFVFRKECRHA